MQNNPTMEKNLMLNNNSFIEQTGENCNSSIDTLSSEEVEWIPGVEYDETITQKAEEIISIDNRLAAVKEFLEAINYTVGEKETDVEDCELFTRALLPGINKTEKLSRNLIVELSKLNESQGKNIYFVVNGQSHKKQGINYGKCFFFEIDKDDNGNPIPLHQQYNTAVEAMGGLLPSYVLFTGGKSLHFYYALDKEVDIQTWENFQKDLIAHVPHADLAIKDPPRIMRLPGFHYKGGNKGYSAIKYSSTGNRSSYEELRDIVPTTSIAPSQKVGKKPSKSVVKGSFSKVSPPHVVSSNKPTVSIAKDCNGCVFEFAEKVLGIHQERLFMDAGNLEDGTQNNALYELTVELIAAVQCGAISEEDAREVGLNFISRLKNHDPSEPWEDDHFLDLYQREEGKCFDYNGLSKVVSPVGIQKSSSSSSNSLAPSFNAKPSYDAAKDWDKYGISERNRLIIALYKGGTKPEEDTLPNTPIRRNLLTGEIEFFGEAREVKLEKIEFENRHNISHRNFEDIVTNEAEKNSYNPVAELLAKLYFRLTTEKILAYLDYTDQRCSLLPKYKHRFVANYHGGRVREKTPSYEEVFPPLNRHLNSLEEFITKVFGITDQWYIEAVVHMMISAVARAFQPGSKVDTVTIFKSRQGVNKSSSIQALAFDRFYVSKRGNSISSKDDLMESSRGWLQEYGEIEQITCTRGASETKDNFSRKEDVYRKPYAKVAKAYPRHWIDIGTTNSDTLFLDVDNRRYNVVEIADDVTIDKDFLVKHRDEAWALATQLYFQGEKWWYSEDEEGAEVRRQRNRQYMYVDERSEAILDLVGDRIEYVSANCIALLLEGYDIEYLSKDRNEWASSHPVSKQSVNDARDILKKSGWKKSPSKVTLPNGRRTTAAYINPNYKP